MDRHPLQRESAGGAVGLPGVLLCVVLAWKRLFWKKKSSLCVFPLLISNLDLLFRRVVQIFLRVVLQIL